MYLVPIPVGPLAFLNEIVRGFSSVCPRK